MDLVGTCPQKDWAEWLAEGDCAGEPPTGRSYCWYTRHPLWRLARTGSRFYIVAHGRLRGFAPVLGIQTNLFLTAGTIIREGGAVAVTIPQSIKGFQGLRERWWDRADEVPFPDWRLTAAQAWRTP